MTGSKGPSRRSGGWLRPTPGVGIVESKSQVTFGATVTVPLLPSEVTGHDNILEFSRLLVSEGQEKRKINRRLDPSKQTTLYDFENGSDEEWIPKVGDTVTVQNLVKKPEYNGHVGKIVSYSEENGRYGVKFTMKGEKEGEDQVISLAIQRYGTS